MLLDTDVDAIVLVYKNLGSSGYKAISVGFMATSSRIPSTSEWRRVNLVCSKVG